MISTTTPDQLPNPSKLQQICKAISVLDAILSREWEYRYFSYQNNWAEGEEFFEMRDGSGDHMLILFREDGTIINGMAHEYHPKNKTLLTHNLPIIFNEFISGEPVHSIGTTFCLWTTGNDSWEYGAIEDYNDGSESLLWIFDGNPKTYIDWAADYYEDSFEVTSSTHAAVSAIYTGQPLTRQEVLTIVPGFDDWEGLNKDLVEIGFHSTNL